MGSLTVYLLRYGKVMLAWSFLVAGAAVFYTALSNSTAFQTISSLHQSALSAITDAASAVPLRVQQVNDAIRESLDDSNGFAQLLFWLAGFDVLQSILTYIIAQISAIVSAVVLVGTSALAFAGAAWALRRTQRWIRAASGGDLNVDVLE